MKWAWKLIERCVVQDTIPRDQLYRQEAARIRTGDGLSWALMLTGFIPLAWQNPALTPLWIGVFVLWFLARKNGWALNPQNASRGAFAALAAGLVYWIATRDTVWAFVIFLVLIALVLVHKTDLEIEVPRLYLVAFTLFLVFAHLTLEYSFLVVLFAMVLSGILLMLRYHFPEQVQRGKYLQTARVLVRPVLMAVALTVPVFVVCPRVPVATLNIKQAPHTGGFSERIKFGDMRSSLESDRTFMTIRTPKERKWRGIVMDFYDGQGWRRTPRAGKRHESTPEGIIWIDARQRARGIGAFESAEVILEPTDCRYYFAPRFPIAMESEFGAVLHDNARALLRTEDPQSKRIRYMVWFGDVLPGESDIDTAEMARFLKVLPTMSSRIADLAKRVTAGATTDRQKAVAVEKFLAQGEYTYSLGGAPPPNRDPVEWFLFEAKTGHCEYYSSAMALMLRTLKIPTRVVNGFNPGKYDKYAGTWTVLERNAHSWCECYLPEEGWVEFDPTTGNGREPITSLVSRLGLDNYQWFQMAVGLLNRADFEWQRCVVSFSVSMQWGILQAIYKWYEDFEIRVRTWWNQVRVARLGAIASGLAVLFLLANIFRKQVTRFWRWLMLMLVPWWEWLRRELARVRARRREGQTGAFYRELIELMERHGLTRSKHETPWELANRLGGLAAEMAAPARAVTDAYCRVAYRGQALEPADETAVRGALDTLASLLRARGALTAPPRAP